MAIAVALTGIGASGQGSRSAAWSVTHGAVAGITTGLSLVVIDQASAGGLWPLVAGAAVATLAMIGFTALRGYSLVPPRPAVAPAAAQEYDLVIIGLGSGGILAAEFAAGDHYDHFEMNDGTLGFGIGDVSGHGFSSALLMASTHAYIHALATMDLAIEKVLKETGRIFQYGTQQRSIPHCWNGCELVRRGAIGKVHTIEVDAPKVGDLAPDFELAGVDEHDAVEGPAVGVGGAGVADLDHAGSGDGARDEPVAVVAVCRAA